MTGTHGGEKKKGEKRRGEGVEKIRKRKTNSRGDPSIMAKSLK